MQGIIISTLLGMVAKLVTSDFIEWAIIKAAEILVARTDNHWDDDLVVKVKEALAKK
jgi:alanine dehydrogenase